MGWARSCAYEPLPADGLGTAALGTPVLAAWAAQAVLLVASSRVVSRPGAGDGDTGEGPGRLELKKGRCDLAHGRTELRIRRMTGWVKPRHLGMEAIGYRKTFGMPIAYPGAGVSVVGQRDEGSKPGG